MQSRLLLLWIATLSSAELFVNYDQKLEDRPRLFTLVKEEVGKLDIPAKSDLKNDDGKQSTSYWASVNRALKALDIVPVLEDAASRTVSAVRMDTAIPKDPSVAQLAPHVENGKTTYAPTTTTTHTFTTTYYQYYYWTVTWYYWYYYWTYSIDIQASIVTSTRSTTWTTFSVKTTDAAAASEYFSSKSQTLSLPTPAAATSLESLAGSTSFVSSSPSPRPSPNPSPTDESSITEAPSPPFSVPLSPEPSAPGDSDSSSTSKSSSSTTSLLRNGGDDGPPSNGGGNGGGNGGNDSSGAKPLWVGSDWKTVWVLLLGAGTGLLAVIL
ncbi:hypothetical protein TrVFT333_006339 [Trichoderma virens FT-333]|nr:hypothetical protein TrVFT333_006339 [Trichoderma virens FT-333]